MELWADAMLAEADGDREFVVDLAAAFLDVLPAGRAALDRAIAHRDAAALAEVAHRIRGSAAHLCAPALADTAAVVEQSIGAGRPQAAFDRCPVLLAQLEALEREMRAFVIA
jgi:HPt (histidine-containing phosphotransfer) domain-containing protein